MPSIELGFTVPWRRFETSMDIHDLEKPLIRMALLPIANRYESGILFCGGALHSSI
jgi:hypothetical protein